MRASANPEAFLYPKFFKSFNILKMKSISAKQIMLSVEEAFLNSELETKTSIELISEITGQSIATIHQFFTTKDDLFLLLLSKNKQELMIFLAEEARNTSFIKFGFKDFCINFFLLIATTPSMKLINFSIGNLNLAKSAEHQNKICEEIFRFLVQLSESNYNLKFTKFDEVGKLIINSQIKNLVFFDTNKKSIYDDVANHVDSLIEILLKE